jgi:hypothetical protein
MDRLRAYMAPHGSLPPGSVVLIGSISHLRAKGLADYAESLVGTSGNILGRAGVGVEVAPLVNIPLHGLESTTIIRSLLDLDGWLINTQQGVGTVLPTTRNTFWSTLAGDETQELVHVTEAITMVMPSSFRNHRRRPLTSDPFVQPIPVQIPPVDEEKEGIKDHALANELNDIFGLNLDPCPETERLAAPTDRHDNIRTVFFGASHMLRIKEVLEHNGMDIKGMCIPGWLPTKESVNTMTNICAELKLEQRDLVVIDVWSNSAHMGTDEAGLPCRPVKNRADGRYHVPGELQAAPKTAFSAALKEIHPIIGAAGGAQVVLLAPIARYLNSGCCSDPLHITNRGTADFKAEMLRAETLAATAAGGDPLTVGIRVCRPSEILGNIDGDPANWLGGDHWTDAVHLTPDAYLKVGQAIVAETETGAALSAKRMRLESIVPATAASRQRGTSSVQLPPWVSGKSARASRGRGRGGPARGGTNWMGNNVWGRGGGGWRRGRQDGPATGGRGGRGRGRGFASFN